MTIDNVIAIIQQQFDSFSAEYFLSELTALFRTLVKDFKKVLLVDMSRSETMNDYWHGKNSFAKISKNLIRYRCENKFVALSKL